MAGKTEIKKQYKKTAMAFNRRSLFKIKIKQELISTRTDKEQKIRSTKVNHRILNDNQSGQLSFTRPHAEDY